MKNIFTIILRDKRTGQEVARNYDIDIAEPDKYGFPLKDMIEALKDNKLKF